ncbi:hypothetical protein D9M68_555040 [compost metagenome]
MVVPYPTTCILPATMIATAGLELVYEMGNPEFTVAPGSKSAVAKGFAGICGKLITWFPLLTVSVCETLTAAS